MGHHAGISSANTRSVPTASATAKISCAYARPVQVNMVASNPGVLYRELRPPLDSGCDRHHKICDWYRVRAMPPGRVHRDQSYSAARRCVRLRSTRCPLLAQSGHELVRRTCPLLTQSGHRCECHAAASFCYPNRCSTSATISSQNMPTAHATGPSGCLRRLRRITTAVPHIAKTRISARPTKLQKRNGSVFSTSHP
jgi:hypothetical protein